MTHQRKGKLDGPGVGHLIEILCEPSPATFVRQVLVLYLERQLDFEAAWAQAMRALPRTLPDVAWWRGHFHDEKHRWKAEYEQAQQRTLTVA